MLLLLRTATYPSPSYLFLSRDQMCADLCDGTKYFGTQYGNEV